MDFKNKKDSLDYFQKHAEKTSKQYGYATDISSNVLGIMIEMRNICLGAEKNDTILLHKAMGNSAWHIANYTSLNNLKLSNIVANKSFDEMWLETHKTDLEEYLELIKDDLTFSSEMSDSDKELFIMKSWISIFISDYTNDFIKVDRILKSNVSDNKIKYPEAYALSEDLKYGME